MHNLPVLLQLAFAFSMFQSAPVRDAVGNGSLQKPSETPSERVGENFNIRKRNYIICLRHYDDDMKRDYYINTINTCTVCICIYIYMKLG